MAKNFNRYARIHVLFDVLAKELTKKDKEASITSLPFARIVFNVKRHWKNFFGIESLTELSDESLQSLELLVEKRIESLKNGLL